MSADNWALCPKCQGHEDEDFIEPSLREDYEQGINQDGVYYCSYSGVCRKCGFEYHVKVEEQAWQEESYT